MTVAQTGTARHARGMSVDAPNRYPLPPLLTVGAVLLGWLVHVLTPSPLPDGLAPLGWTLVAAALAIDVWAALTFRRHRANIRPDRAATTLIEDGPFARSRNPIYLANVMLTAGLGLALSNGWLLLAALVLLVALRQLAVMREEEHMARRFPAAWPAYAARVRRWL